MFDVLLMLGTLALRLTTLGSVAFVALFAVLAPWRRTVMGRHMMTFMTVMTVILLYVTLAPLLGTLDLSTRLWIRLAMIVSLGGAIWWMVGLLVHAQAGNLRRRAVAQHQQQSQNPSSERSPAMLDRYAKAIVGAIMAVLTGLATALTDGHVTATEIVTMAIVGLGALGIVWGVPNDTTTTVALVADPEPARTVPIASVPPVWRDQTSSDPAQTATLPAVP
jgi:hypothetical protein